jgi:hypothetical protein
VGILVTEGWRRVAGPSPAIWLALPRGRAEEGDLGEERTDRRAPSISDGGAGNGNGPLTCEIGLGGTAALGRPQRKRPTTIFPFLILFLIE